MTYSHELTNAWIVQEIWDEVLKFLTIPVEADMFSQHRFQWCSQRIK